ncbi:MAG: hypothetical protein WC444_06495 [Candidatus Paceibacterota bacterium]
MCAPGVGVGEGANVVTAGDFGDLGEGESDSTDADVSAIITGVASEMASATENAAETGFGGGASGMDAAEPLLGKSAIKGSDIAQVASMFATPAAAAIIAGMDYAGAFDGIGGNVSSAALGGPGADPRPTYGQSYHGPGRPPVGNAMTGSPTSGVIAPTIRTGVEFAAERGRTPAEIDAANRLRISREQAYAEQRTNAESELLKALSLRDPNPEANLSESRPASARFVGLPPTIGQARHRWA